VPNPDIVLNKHLQGISPGRIPNGLADEVDPVIVSADDCDVPREKNAVADGCIAVNNTSSAKLYPIAEADISVR